MLLEPELLHGEACVDPLDPDYLIDVRTGRRLRRARGASDWPSTVSQTQQLVWQSDFSDLGRFDTQTNVTTSGGFGVLTATGASPGVGACTTIPLADVRIDAAVRVGVLPAGGGYRVGIFHRYAGTTSHVAAYLEWGGTNLSINAGGFTATAAASSAIAVTPTTGSTVYIRLSISGINISAAYYSTTPPGDFLFPAATQSAVQTLAGNDWVRFGPGVSSGTGFYILDNGAAGSRWGVDSMKVFA